MEGLAKNAEVKYTVGDTDGEELPDDALLAKAMASLSEIDKEELEEEMDNTEVEAEKPKGLMARRGDM